MLSINKINAPLFGDKTRFDFPSPPDSLPGWAQSKSLPWQNLLSFEIITLAGKRMDRRLEIRYEDLPDSLWGLHVARGNRVRIIVNTNLPAFWQRFALFHELFHVLEHRRGEDFWNRTATPMSSFERQADLFAWAVVLAEGTTEGNR